MLKILSSRYIFCYLAVFVICLNAQPCACAKNKLQNSQRCSTCDGHGEKNTGTKLRQTICTNCNGTGFIVKQCECVFSLYVVGELSATQVKKTVNRLVLYLERYNKTEYSKYRMYCEGEIKEAACGIFALRKHAKWALPTISRTIKKMSREMEKKPKGYYGVDPYLEMAIFRIWLVSKQASVPYLIDLLHDDLCRHYAIDVLVKLDADISKAIPHVLQYKYDKRKPVQEALQRFYKRTK